MRLMSRSSAYPVVMRSVMVLVGLTLPGYAYAQNAAGSEAGAEQEHGGHEGESVQIDEITVEGREISGHVPYFTNSATKTETLLLEAPQSISVVPQRRLELQDIGTPSEALRYVPGVRGGAFGNDSRVDFLRFRGFDGESDSVYRDGLKLRSAPFAQYRPELYGAERVEVLRGPVSVLYGQANPGGLLNVVTKRPSFESLREITIQKGSFDHHEARFDISGAVADDSDFAYRFTGLARDSDTQVDFVEDDRLYFAPAFTWQPNSSTRLTFLSHFQEDETGSTNQFLPAAGTLDPNPNGEIPPSRFIGEPGFDRFDRSVQSIGYIFEHRLNDTWRVEQRLRYNRVEVDSETVFGAGLQADQRTLNRFAFAAFEEAESIGIDNQAQAAFMTGPLQHRLLIGIAHESTDLDTLGKFGLAPAIDIFNPQFGATVNPAVSSQSQTSQGQTGLYIQDQISFAESWILTLGGRQDYVSTDTRNLLAATEVEQDDSEFSGRAGITYVTPIGLAPYVSYTESFLPTVGTNVFGDPFEPETAEQYEAGIKYQPHGSDSLITLAVFDLRRENLPTTDPNNPINQIQTGEVRSRGLEIEANIAFENGLNLTGAYTYQDVEIIESTEGDEGLRLSGRPEHFGSFWADYTWQKGILRNLVVGAGVRYVGTTTDVANTFKTDAYTLVDAALRYDWNNIQFRINAENLFDNEHVVSCSSRAACFFGQGQTVVGGISYYF